MIVPQSQIRKLLSGEKTQKRYPVSTVDGRVVRCMFVPGRVYAVQCETAGAVKARVSVVSRHRELLGGITAADARREGHKTVAAFAAHWMLLHDSSWPVTVKAPCPVCDASGGPAGEPCDACGATGQIDQPVEMSDDEVLARFQARHGHRTVWVVVFALERGQPVRLLHRHSERGYAVAQPGGPRPKDALPGELEAVDDVTLARFAEEARREHRSAPRARQTVSRDLARRVRQAALRADPDAPELAKIYEQLQQLEARQAEAA